jgi:hypothetical protein
MRSIIGLWLGLSFAALSAAEAGQGSEPASATVAGNAFDAAPFAQARYDADAHAYTVRWDEPRKIRRLEVEFETEAVLPAAGAVRVQYWCGAWDGRADPIQAERGVAGAGWTAVDDWTNGRWKDADTRVEQSGNRWSYRFAPTAAKEFKDLGQPGVAYRKTLKIRLLAEKSLPKPRRFRAFTDAVCRPLGARILWGTPATAALRVDGENAGHLEVYNGSVRALRPLGPGGPTVGSDLHWTLSAGAQGGIEADLLMAVDPSDGRYDRTIVTVRSRHNPFSFSADEVALGERILVDDLGVLVVRSDDPITWDGYRQARKEFPGRTVYERVAGMPEQTLSGAWNDMPLKRPLWFVHGLPGNRNAMRQDPNGEITVSGAAHWFGLPTSDKDSRRKGWKGDWLTLGFGFPPADRRGGRELREGYLPLLRTWWVDGPIYYEQNAILDKLAPDLGDVRLDDPTVLLMQVRMLNVSASTPGVARLHLTCSATQSERLAVEGDRVLARGADGSRLRYLLQTGHRGKFHQNGDAVDWSLASAPGQSHPLLAVIPAVTLKKDEEIEPLRRRDFSSDSRRICQFWQELSRQSAQIETPEPWLNDFYKSHLRHLEVNCLRDATGPRRYAHVGTMSYGVFANESTMMVSDLDRRGCHQAAEQCLQTWLDFQGTVPLPGNFKSAEGVFHGAGGQESIGYNKHHGYVMWNMAEHWWYTRDRAWMERAAPKLIKACDWVSRERRATMAGSPAGGRPIEYGFLPAGGLEDVQDYWYWLATNVNTVWGFDALAHALADFGHPEGARLQREAKAYHDDVLRGLNEARIRTPVVRLRDGTYVPKYPSHLHARGRALGWIRETLEGSLFLLIDGLLPPDGPEAAWILKDYEDNLYISNSYGYSIPVFDRFWFSRGGFSMQANLLDGPIPYLLRDEIKHYLRAYFNGFASGFYPEIRMCNEHSNPELGYPFGDHFKSSDEAQLTCWLRLMFVHEQGADLYLGQAIPRYWLAHGNTVGIEHAASHFGPLSLRLRSQADGGQITAVLVPPERNRPHSIYLRLRHPQGKPIRSVTLNGANYDRFDAQKEWIVLPGTLRGTQEVVARY